jgi:hypothetical protein
VGVGGRITENGKRPYDNHPFIKLRKRGLEFVPTRGLAEMVILKLKELLEAEALKR